jgi:transcriptional regulator with XRE-family HTH domain
MGNSNKSLLTQSLKRIKEKHGLTIESWAEKANVPESTVARYLSSSLNIPNFPYVCAMLKAVDESIDCFYDSIDKKIDVPVEALKLDAVPTAVVGDVVVDTPETAAAIQERIIVQAEDLQAQKAALREKEALISLYEAKLEMMERLLEEKEHTLEAVEEISERRLHALKVLCSAQ